jgi:hypothetical protein
MNAPNITDSPDAPLAVRSSYLLATFGDNYPIIAVLDKQNGWYLVAHPNGPAIANSRFDLLASLAHEHEDVPESIRRDAVWKLMGWAAKQPTWPKVANDKSSDPAQ